MRWAQVVEGGAGGIGDRHARAALRGRAGWTHLLRHEGAEHVPLGPDVHAPPRGRAPRADRRRLRQELRAPPGRPLRQGAGLVR